MKRKVIYLYKETHLPAEGWLQGCFICDTITSKTEEFKPVVEDTKVKYVVHICPPCIKHKNNNIELNNLYLGQLNDYINHLH
uniref:Uncharacterized protein n=1 Tax=viral metagenome TaxID=1070528 RepID=A0A6C0CNP4_9ZZZZ